MLINIYSKALLNMKEADVGWVFSQTLRNALTPGTGQQHHPSRSRKRLSENVTRMGENAFTVYASLCPKPPVENVLTQYNKGSCD